jgi:phosphate transport system ATP-binding protein
MSENPCIIIDHLSVQAGGQDILKDISLIIPEKKITVIIGPSGCGKSTLLRCMNRLTDQDPQISIQGSIWYNGENIFDSNTNVSDLRRSVGMIQQTPTSLPTSIRQNVLYGPMIHGEKSASAREHILSSSLERVGLWEEVRGRLDDPASSLSIGQQQRLALARTLAVGSRVLLCDEVTSALDPVSARKVEEELLSLKGEYTIIFVTHILRQAKRMADNVVFLYMGEVLEDGEANDFFTEQKNYRTREYLSGVFG